MSPAEVSAATSKWPTANEASLASGRQLFVGNCNKCHGYPAMTAVPESKWPGTVHRMAGKAHLGAEEEQQVLQFILAARGRESK